MAAEGRHFFFHLHVNADQQPKQKFVIPAQAGIQFLRDEVWIPACAGMTMM